MDDQEKVHWRGVAIDRIGEHGAADGDVALVTGHLMFWSEEQEAGDLIWTENDAKTYTHMLFLDVPAKIISERREKVRAVDVFVLFALSITVLTPSQRLTAPTNN